MPRGRPYKPTRKLVPVDQLKRRNRTAINAKIAEERAHIRFLEEKRKTLLQNRKKIEGRIEKGELILMDWDKVNYFLRELGKEENNAQLELQRLRTIVKKI